MALAQKSWHLKAGFSKTLSCQPVPAGTAAEVAMANRVRNGQVFQMMKVADADRLGSAMFWLIILIFTLSGSGEAGISLGGTSGLIHIPTAEVLSDQQVTVGLGYVHRQAAYLERGRCDNYPVYIVLGYLPRLEFSAGVTFVPGTKSYDGTNTYKDGVVSLQYLVLKERKYLPALALGARDIYSFILLNTTYVVASKSIVAKPTIHWRLHIGYGSDIIDHHLGVPKKDRQFPVGHTIVGLFGGLEINWKNRLSYVLEYDSQKMNTGFRFHWLRNWQLDLVLLNMEYWSGNLNCSFSL